MKDQLWLEAGTRQQHPRLARQLNSLTGSVIRPDPVKKVPAPGFLPHLTIPSVRLDRDMGLARMDEP